MPKCETARRSHVLGVGLIWEGREGGGEGVSSYLVGVFRPFLEITSYLETTILGFFVPFTTLGAGGLSRALISLVLHASYVSYIFTALPPSGCRERTSGIQGNRLQS